MLYVRAVQDKDEKNKTEVGSMTDGEAHEKLKKEERGRPEWTITVFKKPRGLKIDHMGEIHQLAEDDLKELLYTTEMKRGVSECIWCPDLARLSWLPKYMYKKFLKSACESLDVPYTNAMLVSLTPPRWQKAYVIFPVKTPIDLAEKRVAEIKEREQSMKREITELGMFLRGVKEMREREKK